MENLYGSKLKNLYGDKPDHVKLKPNASDKRRVDCQCTTFFTISHGSKDKKVFFVLVGFEEGY